ncbi:MAG: autotransporter assembly complex family protein [Lentisphaerota bacterium]
MITYGVTVQGVKDAELRNVLLAVSDCRRLKNLPPATPELLNDRARDDFPLLLRALRSYGYYEAAVTSHVAKGWIRDTVVFGVNTGPPFLLAQVQIKWAASHDGRHPLLPLPSEMGLLTNKPARSRALVDAETQLCHFLADEGYPEAVVAQRQFTVDYDLKSVTAEYELNPGSPAVFGPCRIEGLARVHESYVRLLIPWKEGEAYRISLMNQVREKLLRTGLFSMMNLSPASEPSPDGALPLALTLRERRRRSIGISVGYATDKGYGSKVSWANRNLFGNAESLTWRGEWSESVYSGGLSYSQPLHLHPDRNLTADALVADDKPDVYHSRYFRTSLNLGREWPRYLSGSLGIALKVSHVTQLETEGDFILLSLPGMVALDTRDNDFDPERGGFYRLQTAPTWDLYGNSTGYLKTQATLQHYLNLFNRPNLILAARCSIGSLVGADPYKVPADERFYSGGGGSIRGYAYQSVGPVASNLCVGGNSLFEVSLETRFHLTQNFGLVLFLDGGSAFNSDFPDASEQLLWGTGVGLRYFTMLGPIRLDAGFPLNRRPEMDQSFQVYLSIGQAF